MALVLGNLTISFAPKCVRADCERQPGLDCKSCMMWGTKEEPVSIEGIQRELHLCWKRHELRVNDIVADELDEMHHAFGHLRRDLDKKFDREIRLNREFPDPRIRDCARRLEEARDFFVSAGNSAQTLAQAFERFGKIAYHALREV